MAVNVRPVDREQPFLMPPSVLEWLPENHLAFFVIDSVAELDLSEFYHSYREDGRGGSVYEPAMMLSVLLYAYCTGDRSSRRIERRCLEDVAYRVLTANQFPDHATLARFRRRHEESIARLFGQVLGLCVESGLVDAGVIAIDGTKISADASYFANKSREDLAAEILSEADTTDIAEDRHNTQRDGRLPDDWTGGTNRKERIRAALNELERQKAQDFESRIAERAEKEAELGRKLTGPKPKPDAARRPGERRANTTDPHSRVIPTRGRGVMQGYNAQAATTVEHIIVAAEITTTPNDQVHFIPMANASTSNLTAANYREHVGAFVADAGYWSTANGTSNVGADVLIATRKPAHRTENKPDDDRLMVLAKVNRGELSQRQAGLILGISYTAVRDMTKRYFGTEGQRISKRPAPTPQEWIPVVTRVERGEISRRAARDELHVSDARIKTMLAHVRGEATDPGIARTQMDEKLAQPENHDRYAKRQHSIEPVFGNIKANLGYRRFIRRGYAAVQSEWRLICTAHNLLKLHRGQLA